MKDRSFMFSSVEFFSKKYFDIVDNQDVYVLPRMLDTEDLFNCTRLKSMSGCECRVYDDNMNLMMWLRLGEMSRVCGYLRKKEK